MREIDQSVATSVVITAHNEARELERTIRSVRRNTQQLHEIIVVDDGSTDGSCGGLVACGVTVIRHHARVGVAKSRHEATQIASGNVVAYLDGHQRVSSGCLDQMSHVALEHQAIVSVDTCGFRWFPTIAYGADFQLCPAYGYFSAQWLWTRPMVSVSQVTSLKAPAYVVPRTMYDQVGWSPALRGWGGSEAAIALKAFFLGIRILHLHGPLAKHRFRRSFPYATTWEEVWRNQALIARVCFDERTWRDYWLPEVFDSHLSEQARADLESEAVIAEHREFVATKVRSDLDFWRQLLGQPEPKKVR